MPADHAAGKLRDMLNPERRERWHDRPWAGIWVAEGAGIEDDGGLRRTDERAWTAAYR
jgi:hypothetical protein